jgi:hypothetical protein
MLRLTILIVTASATLVSAVLDTVNAFPRQRTA